MKQGIYNLLRCIVWGLCIFLIAASLFGCKSKEAIVDYQTARTDTLRLYTRDSVRVHDSVTVTHFMQGDTIYLTRDRWHTLERIRTDTVRQVRTDTVYKAITSPVSASKQKGEGFYVTVGKYATGAVIGMVLMIVARIFLRKK